MTLEEAKEFYFQYSGFSFHMDREEPVRYNSLRMMDLDEDILSQWDEELLDLRFEALWDDPDRVWSLHRNILDIISRNRCDASAYLARLLKEMEKMGQLDLSGTTLVVENMAGRTESMQDGGVYIFCRYSDLGERMNETVERLIASCSAKHGGDQRFDKAVSNYRRAYRKWKDLKK
jgi:hypothetical protein